MNSKEIAEGQSHLIRLWSAYRSFVARVTTEPSKCPEESLAYWRGHLFTNFITYLFPICFIALIPGVYFGFKLGYPFIAVFDLLSAFSIFMVVFNARINLLFRKVFVVLVLYSLAVMLIFYLGMFGPGTIYLFAIGIFIVLTFPSPIGCLSIAVNFAICVCFALMIYLKPFAIPLTVEYNLGSWIAVSSNLLFLGSVCVLLINKALKGLEATIISDLLSRTELQAKNAEGILNNSLLTDSESRYKSLFFLNPSPMWVLDSDTLQFLQVNESAILNYGYSEEEFLAMDVREIKVEKNADIIHSDIHKSQRTRIPTQIITQHRKKNNEVFFVEVIFSSIVFKGKKASLVIARDITEQTNYIKAIEAQNDVLREISWMQSHEVRGPLSTIMGLSYLFTNDVPDIPICEIMDGIRSSSEKLDTVIRNIVTKANNADPRSVPTGNYTNL